MKKTALIAIFLSLFCFVNLSCSENDFQKTTRLAKSGDAEAQYNLGVMYFEGQDVPQNYTEAMKWFKKSADQGYAKAEFNLGLIYSQGKGVIQDYDEAVKWFKKWFEKAIQQIMSKL